MSSVRQSQHFPAVRFGPRRLGHVNLAVSDLERSHEFYQNTIGLSFIFDEPEIEIRFYSNGNSHHDLALGQASEKEFRGRDGHLLKSKDHRARAGLNHIAFEMRTELELVEAIARAESSDLKVSGYFNHQISHSVYFSDPNGVELEIYADTNPDFRAIYARNENRLITERWDPTALHADHEERFVASFEPRYPADSLARPLRTAQAALVVEHLTESVEFYENVVGLSTIALDNTEGGWAILAGTLGHPDILLLEGVSSEPLGLHHFALELESPEEFDATERRLLDAGCSDMLIADHALKRGIVLRDPDGVRVELFATLRQAGDDAPTYEAVASPQTREYLL